MPKADILLVDDEDELRMILAHTIEAESYAVESARDGDEAIDLVRAKHEKGGRFDVVLLDIMMPKVNGFEVLKYIKSTTPETKVIMITAYADVKNAIEALRMGASGFISKPYDLDDIFTSITRALEE